MTRRIFRSWGMIAAAVGGQFAAQAAKLDGSLAQTRDCDDCVAVALVSDQGTGLKPFYMAVFETSWREYLTAVREANCPEPRNRDGKLIPGAINLDDDYAVSGVTYAGALCFTQWLSRKSSHSYHLPTPAQWEAAAKSASLSAPSPEEKSEKRREPEPRDAVRGGVARHVRHGNPSRDGIYGLLDGVGEMTDAFRARTQEQCAIYKLKQCHQVRVQGLLFPGNDGVYQPVYIMPEETNSHVGFRVVRD